MLLPLPLLALQWMVIPHEQARLRARFGSAYEQCCAQDRALVVAAGRASRRQRANHQAATAASSSTSSAQRQILPRSPAVTAEAATSLGADC